MPLKRAAAGACPAALRRSPTGVSDITIAVAAIATTPISSPAWTRSLPKIVGSS